MEKFQLISHISLIHWDLFPLIVCLAVEGLQIRGLEPEERHNHRTNNPEKIVDDNLSEMVNSITRLKGK